MDTENYEQSLADLMDGMDLDGLITPSHRSEFKYAIDVFVKKQVRLALDAQRERYKARFMRFLAKVLT